MAKYFIQDETLTNLADKIRILNGTEDTMTPDEMNNELTNANEEVDAQSVLIDQLSEMLESKASGGNAEPVLQNKTVTPTTSKQSVTADSGYDGLDTVTINAVPTATQATPSITVSSSGLITASAIQSEGYVSSGTKSATKQLTVQAAQTITPSTVNQTIASGTYLTGAQTIKGDSNLVASNIKSGVSIFGVNGSYEGSGSSIPSNPSASPKAVNFRDYDGTILYSYTKDEALALISLPSLPSQQGLTCQGWNWSLEDMKSYVESYGKLEIGAMYITNDGKTRIYITLQEGRTSPMLGVCPKGTVTIDWGDGSESTLTGTSTSTVKWTNNHNYTSAGDYVITLTVNGSMGFHGTSNSNQYSEILRHSSSADGRNYTYRNAIQKIEIGDGVTNIGFCAFYNCGSLASITIPNGVISIGESAFSYCNSFANITIPNSVTSIGEAAFRECDLLASIIMPNSVTSIGRNLFWNCRSIASIIIPNSVTSIGSSAFYNCCSLAKLRFNSTTPPTVSSSDAFTKIPTDCIISVPTGALSAYISATNYPSSSTYTYIEED